MQVGVSFYRAAAKPGVENIKAPLMIQYAKSDPRINAIKPASRKR